MLGRDGVDLCEADVGGVEAVCLVNFGDSLVSWLCEDDVDALHMLVNLSFNTNFGGIEDVQSTELHRERRVLQLGL